LILTAVLVVGAAFDNKLGHLLRTSGAALALFFSLVVMTGRIERTMPSWALEAYPLLMSVIIAGYGIMLGHRASLASGGLILSAWMAALSVRGYTSLRQVVAGIDYIAIGMALLGLAVLTSMAKGGVLTWRITNRRDKVADAPD
jgi:hypothetical protein